MEISAIFRAYVPLTFSSFDEGMRVEGVSRDSQFPYQNQVDLYCLAMLQYCWILSNTFLQIQEQTRKEGNSAAEKTRKAREQKHEMRLQEWKKAEQKYEELHHLDWGRPFFRSVASQAAHFDCLTADPLYPETLC
ncbi:MAG: hypothetical protein K940chlam9_01590 [Chlamydiae bacterium]|nr:hypothetical protein [Chlamydiota bacterium]